MPSPGPPLPAHVENDVIYGCAGPQAGGVCFCLRLTYRDETMNPPRPEQFEHEWIVLRAELDRAEREGRLDAVLLKRRIREERIFLKIVEQRLRHRSARLERVERGLVMLQMIG